jgi:hypothetical protein
MSYRTRREVLGVVGTAGIVGIAGCSSSEETATETETPTEAGAASLVEQYYTAAANGELEQAASSLAMTQLERSGDGASAEELADAMEDNRGMSQDGIEVSLGEFNELSMSEFAAFTFSDDDGEQQEVTEQEAAELVPKASAFGGDEEQVTLVHHTGGFVPSIWVPYQPIEEPADDYGEVIVYVGPYEGDPFIIGDFRSYTELKLAEK